MVQLTEKIIHEKLMHLNVLNGLDVFYYGLNSGLIQRVYVTTSCLGWRRTDGYECLILNKNTDEKHKLFMIDLNNIMC